MGAAIMKSLMAEGAEGGNLTIAKMHNEIEEVKKQNYDDIRKELEANLANGKQYLTSEDSLFKPDMNSIGRILFPTTQFPPPEMGLHGLHVYSITKVFELEVNGITHQLIRIRNPWGNGIEWTGAWSDNSDEWKALSKAQKDALGFRKDDDGEFFMTYDDFIQVIVNQTYFTKEK